MMNKKRPNAFQDTVVAWRTCRPPVAICELCSHFAPNVREQHSAPRRRFAYYFHDLWPREKNIILAAMVSYTYREPGKGM